MKKVILTILDGVGFRKSDYGNAFKQANTPCIDKLLETFPHSLLDASGTVVGLPTGQMGNSEVGHLTIGSGRITYQALEKINNAIATAEFYNNKELLSAFNHAKKNNSKVHILGLLSDGGVHSNIKHFFALLKMAKKQKIDKVYIHVFTDGRDTLKDVAMNYIDQLQHEINEYGIGKIATVSGRYYAMEREGMWDKTKIAYDVLVNGIGNESNNIEEMIEKSYKDGIYDEFIIPTIIDKEGLISDNDSLIVANFRADRLTQTFGIISNPDEFKFFEAKKFNNIKLVTMASCDERIICTNAFPNEIIKNTMDELLSDKGYKLLKIAEKSKYVHITHFFDGDRDVEYPNEDNVLIPRYNVKTYDEYPPMSCKEITNKVIEVMPNYDFIVINYANGDMLGHTGNLKAAIEGMEVIDECIKRLFMSALDNDFTLIITADHGNCEEMLIPNGESLTTHTTNPVHFIVCDNEYKVNDGGLADVAPTILDIMNINIPKEMTGNSLVERTDSEEDEE